MNTPSLTINCVFWFYNNQVELISIDDMNEIQGIVDQVYALENNLGD